MVGVAREPPDSDGSLMVVFSVARSSIRPVRASLTASTLSELAHTTSTACDPHGSVQVVPCPWRATPRIMGVAMT